ncbi:MAG: hypothetical protein EXS08_03950 [Planctomycetes bacterium]|nr:hypothetical protein [Planctomycetota bacterium]
MSTTRFRWPLTLLAGALLLVPSSLAARAPDGGDDDDDQEQELTPCEKTARALREAANKAAQEDYWIGFANCLNVSDRHAAQDCLHENELALREARDLLAAQFDARVELCDDLGGDRYDPRIDPHDFVRGVNNPLFPLVPGRTLVYETVTDEGTERIEVTTTHATKRILGVPCVVVHDFVTFDGEVIEDTLDYFAQDRAGNVWYFGELSQQFENGELSGLEGSWTAGVDHAKPGIVMQATPRVGQVYRQEFQPDVAEDAASILARDRHVSVPYGNFSGCLQTLDFSPLEPDASENKFYAPTIGVVLEVDLTTGERTELIGIF